MAREYHSLSAGAPEDPVSELSKLLAAAASVSTESHQIPSSVLLTDVLAEKLGQMDAESIVGGIRRCISDARSTATALDQLQYCQTLAARLTIKTDARTAQILRSLRAGLEAVANDPRTPVLARLAAEYAEKCVHLEEETPSGNVLTHGLGAERRIEEYNGNGFIENADLQHRLALPRHWSRHDQLRRIASDAVGHLDSNDRLLGVARVQTSDLQQCATVAPLTLRHIAADLAAPQKDVMHVANALESTWSNKEQAIEFGRRIGLNAEAWQAFIESIERYRVAIEQEIIEEIRRRTRRESELSAARNRHEAQMQTLMASVSGSSSEPTLVQAAHQHLVGMERHDRQAAQQALVQCEMHGQRSHYAHVLYDAADAKIADDPATVITALQREHQAAERRLAAHEEQGESAAVQEARETLERSWSTLRSAEDFDHKLHQGLLTLADEEEATLFPAHWRTVETVTHDTTLVPFRPSADEELTLLLRHMHRPAIRRLLEGELNVSLQLLPLATQLHMARFLQTANQATFDRLRRVLRLHPEDAVSILESFFACAEHPQMGMTILALAEHPASVQVLRAYTNLTRGAGAAAEKIATLLRDAGGPVQLTKEYFYRQLIVRANRLLRQFETRLQTTITDGGPLAALAAECAKRLVHENEQVDQTRSLVECLPRSEVSHLNLSQLRTVDLQEAFPASNLKDAGMKERMTAVVRRQFPSGDDREFREDFLENPRSRLVYSTCAGNLLAFFGMTPIDESGERVYLDWFFADPDSPVQYLAEATLISTLKKYEGQHDYEHVAKPHVRSMSIMLEQMPGCVGFGCTRDGEYKHHYLRFRTMRSERTAYRSKSLPAGDLERMWQLCHEADTLKTDKATGLQCCRIVFHGRDHHDDLSAKDDDGFIFRAMQELCEQGDMVLTRAVPTAQNSRGRQEYLCIFEQDQKKSGNQAALSA